MSDKVIYTPLLTTEPHWANSEKESKNESPFVWYREMCPIGWTVHTGKYEHDYGPPYSKDYQIIAERFVNMDATQGY